MSLSDERVVGEPGELRQQDLLGSPLVYKPSSAVRASWAFAVSFRLP
jgi:hypothetical protein